MFLSQLTLLREIFQRNGYPQNFIDTSFKLFLSTIDIKKIIKKRLIQLKKMYLQLFLLHLGTTSLQTRAKLQKSIKGVLNCCKLQVILKIQVSLQVLVSNMQ